MELISKETVEDKANVVLVLFDTLRKNENVVQIDEHARIQQIEKYTMHSTLKCTGRVA